jgi:hypothetical protein
MFNFESVLFLAIFSALFAVRNIRAPSSALGRAWTIPFTKD